MKWKVIAAYYSLQIVTLNKLHLMFFTWNFNSLSFWAPAHHVPVQAAGRRSGTPLSGTGPSPAGILAGSSPPGPFPSHRLSCEEASWQNRKARDIFFNQRQRQGQGVWFHLKTMPGMETCPGKRSINVSKILLHMEASVSCLSTSSAYVCFLCGLSSHILVVHCK